ncbi:MAG: TatD family hydrolase [Bacteroidaceae bacterium]|nr:TatD family hydrolase [Bacteroidaceae bacterium]
MDFLDIHTHDAGRENAILNCSTYTAGRNISVGIHPWEISENWERQFMEIERMAAECNVIAIGECGIDNIKSTANIDTQTEVFKAHALLAEKGGKPLIIHCVKSLDRIIALHRDIKPIQPWIIHGFRGKPQQALQLVNAGLHISLGEHFNLKSAEAIPVGRLFVESDESQLPINRIYAAIAEAKKMPVEELAVSVMRNAAIFEQF